MDRTRLNAYPKKLRPQSSGFTLVEALVAMVVFTVGFSGLFLFFNISQQVITDSQKKMHLNLLASQIVDTIAAQAKRTATDPMNPFITPSQYSGSLAACSYGVNDERQSWCVQLNNEMGLFNSISGKELRDITLMNDGTGLIINVSLVVNHGAVSVFYSRKLRQV
jgi:prepilin-type N-terminal cleavage/methylation domain-containing protein